MSFNSHLKKKISVVNSDRTNRSYLNPKTKKEKDKKKNAFCGAVSLAP